MILFLKTASGYRPVLIKRPRLLMNLPISGFGFIEIGTVTPSPQKGNPRPRIFRLVECDSLISRTGFNNPGLDMIKLRIAQRRNSYVLGININKNPSSEGKQAIGDFLSVYRELYDTADYFTINWNSVETEVMEQALTALAAFRETRTKHVPLLLKMTVPTLRKRR